MTFPLTDAAIVAQVRAGDIAAFTQLVDRYRNVVYGVAYHRLQNFTDAQDVAQETFEQAFRQLNRLHDPAKFAPWLRQVAISQCLMWQRRQHATEVLDDSLPVADQVTAVDSRLAVQQALACLSEETRLTLTLFYFKAYSSREIATFLEVPVSTVKSRLRDARARLKKEMWEMVEHIVQENPLPQDFTAKVGKVLQAQETFVDVLFAPDAMPELFTVWKASDPVSQDDPLLVMVQHLHNGRVRCVTVPPTYEVPGLEVVESEQPVNLNQQSDSGGTTLLMLWLMAKPRLCALYWTKARMRTSLVIP